MDMMLTDATTTINGDVGKRVENYHRIENCCYELEQVDGRLLQWIFGIQLKFCPFCGKKIKSKEPEKKKRR